MVSSYLEQAHRETVETHRRVAQMMTRGGIMPSITGGTGTGDLEASARKQAMNARDQIGRYRDQVHTSVRPIARRIGGQPFRLAKIGKTAPGKNLAETSTFARRECHDMLVRTFGIKSDTDIRVIDQHPLLDRLNGKPSESMPWLTGQAMKQATVISSFMTGYGCWWMPKGKEAIYLPPQWLRPVTTAKGLFQAWALRPEGSQEDTIIPAEDMAYFVEIDPANPMKPLGPLEAGIRTIMVQEYVQEALKRSMQLGLHPGAIVHLAMGRDRHGNPIRKRMKKFQIDQMRNNAEQRLRGPLNYGLWWFVDGLIDKVEPWGNKVNEMDFGENGQSTSERVEQTFGTSPYIVGAKGANRAESAEADRHFVFNTVNPTIEMMSHVLTYSVAPRMGAEGYILFIEPARPHDTEMTQREWETALKYQCALVDEYRTNVLGLPPLPNGIGQAVPIPNGWSFVPLEQLADGYTVTRMNGPQAAVVGPPADTDEPPEPTPDQQEEQVAEGQEADEEAGKAHRPFDRKFYTAYSKAWLKLHGKQEKSLSEALMPLFKKQRKAAVDLLAQHYRTAQSLKGLKGQTIARRIFDPAEWVEQVKEIARERLAHGMAAGARHELAAFDTKDSPSFDLEFEFGREFPPDILDGIKQGLDETLAMDYWSGITDTQLDDLGRELQEALDLGKTPHELSETVSDIFEGNIGKERATRIARTESTWAVSNGQQVAREHLASQGIVDGKEWAATFDMRTRDTHYAANGQERAVKEDFIVGGFPAKAPGDPRLPAKERCFCRCSSLSVVVQGKGFARMLLKTCERHNGSWDGTGWPYQGLD